MNENQYKLDTVMKDWKKFEVFSLHWIISNMKNCKAYLWDYVPHHELFDSGYITNFNNFRLLRLLSKCEKVPDCGIDILIREEKDDTILYHGVQCKHYSKAVSGSHLSYFIPKILMMQRKNEKSNGYLFTSGKITTELKETLLSIGNIYHYKLPFDSNIKIRDINFNNVKVEILDEKSIKHNNEYIESDSEEEEDDFESKIKSKVLIEDELDNNFNEVNLPRRNYQVTIKNKFVQKFRELDICKIVLNITCSLGKTLIVGDVVKELQPKLILALAPLKCELDNLIERLPKFLPDYKVIIFDSDYSTDIEDCKIQLKKYFKSNKKVLLFITFKSAEQKFYDLIFSSIFTNKSDNNIKEDEFEDINTLIDEEEYNIDSEDDSDSDSEDDSDDDDIKDDELESENKGEMVDIFKGAFLFVDEVHNIPINNIKLQDFINFFSKSILCTATLPKTFRDYIYHTHHFDSYDFNYALKNKYICDYNIMIPTLSTKDDNEKMIPVECKSLKKYDIILHKALFLMNGMLMTGSKRCIVYLPTKDECKQFVECWTKIATKYHGVKSWAERINDDTNLKDRNIILKHFEESIDGKEENLKIVTCCNCLNEAVNIVRCDSTYITNVNEKTSEIVMYQRFNRASRLDPKNPNKINHCFIWCEEDYSILKNIILRLKHGLKDNMFDKKVKILNRNYDTYHMKESKENVIKLKQTFDNLINSWISIEERWNINYNKVKKYSDNVGELPLQKDVENCGRWLSKQKGKFKKNELTEYQKDNLRKLKGWKSEFENKIKKMTWDEKYNIVNDYCKKNIGFPKQNDIENCGNWLSKQKEYFKNKKLSSYKIYKLRNLSNWRSEFEIKINKIIKSWDESYNIVKTYNNKHNRLPQKKDKINCGHWLHAQKRNFKNNTLTEKKKNMLRSFKGWKPEFEIKTEKINKSWDESYLILKKYNDKEKKLPKQKDFTNSGNWLSKQKEKIKDNKLTENQKNKLRELKGWKPEFEVREK
jgi:hypothetical protein